MANDPTLRKLVNIMGNQQAEALVVDIFDRIGHHGLDTADDRYRFAVELMKRGGLLEAIGRSIKIQAILLGARAP